MLRVLSIEGADFKPSSISHPPQDAETRLCVRLEAHRVVGKEDDAAEDPIRTHIYRDSKAGF